MNIVMYLNCAGRVLSRMFEICDQIKCNVCYVVNYEKLVNAVIMEPDDIKTLREANVFIYQPFNKNHDHSEWDNKNIIKYLPQSCKIIRVNYYRFHGFWYESSHKPFIECQKYKFNQFIGLHDSFTGFKGEKEEIKEKIDLIELNEPQFLKFFNNKLKEFKNIDDNSDVNMYEFFLSNYRTKHLFHDPYHPTLIFFYEIFRQLIKTIFDINLRDNDQFFLDKMGDIDLNIRAVPILPCIKRILSMSLPEKILILGPNAREVDIYTYYHIRLSEDNFKLFMNQ